MKRFIELEYVDKNYSNTVKKIVNMNDIIMVKKFQVGNLHKIYTTHERFNGVITEESYAKLCIVIAETANDSYFVIKQTYGDNTCKFTIMNKNHIIGADMNPEYGTVNIILSDNYSAVVPEEAFNKEFREDNNEIS